MSKLRQYFLELLRTLGNNSGCHQLPERSFFYKGKQFPVCARCTGTFFGELFAVLLLLFKKILPPKIAVLFLGIMGMDWLSQELALRGVQKNFLIRESTNVRRLITGFFGGLGLFSLYFSGFIKIWSFIQK